MAKQETLHLYHGTRETFAAFRTDRAIFFFEDPAEADAILRHIACEGFASRTILVEFTGRVATEAEALAIWNACGNENEDSYLYSMLCREVGEYSSEEVERFEKALRAAGVDAVRGWDYSQIEQVDGIEGEGESIAVVNHDCVRILNAQRATCLPWRRDPETRAVVYI